MFTHFRAVIAKQAGAHRRSPDGTARCPLWGEGRDPLLPWHPERRLLLGDGTRARGRRPALGTRPTASPDGRRGCVRRVCHALRNPARHARRCVHAERRGVCRVRRGTAPGRLHRWFTSFLVLQGHYTGGDRNAKSQPHAGPCCCPESDKQTSRGSQPVRGGVGAASGARPETAGGVGELQGGPERPAAHGRPHPSPFCKAGGAWRLATQVW